MKKSNSGLLSLVACDLFSCHRVSEGLPKGLPVNSHIVICVLIHLAVHASGIVCFTMNKQNKRGNNDAG